MEKGFIYFIKEDYSNKIKIGKTKNLDHRLNFFEVKLPFNIELIHIVYSNNYHVTERLFHIYYQNKRINGEWFELSEEDIRCIRLANYDINIQRSIAGKEVILKQIRKKGFFANRDFLRQIKHRTTKLINLSANKVINLNTVPPKKKIDHTDKFKESRLQQIKDKEQQVALLRRSEFRDLKRIILKHGETRITALQKLLNVRSQKVKELMEELVTMGWVIKHKSRAKGYELVLDEAERNGQLQLLG